MEKFTNYNWPVSLIVVFLGGGGGLFGERWHGCGERPELAVGLSFLSVGSPGHGIQVGKFRNTLPAEPSCRPLITSFASAFKIIVKKIPKILELTSLNNISLYDTMVLSPVPKFSSNFFLKFYIINSPLIYQFPFLWSQA